MIKIKFVLPILVLLILIGCSGEKQAFAPEGAENRVTVSIIGLDGEVILPETEAGIGENCSVFDATDFLCRKNGIDLDAKGLGDQVYVRSINGLREFDKGEGSGWLYVINGDSTKGGKSAGRYVLTDGDLVVWRYTTDMGRDIGVDIH